MFSFFRKKTVAAPPAAAPRQKTSPLVIVPWWGDPMILAGQPNTTERIPEDLMSLAQDGEGIYRDTVPAWGATFVDVARRISVETHGGGVVFFHGRSYTPQTFEAVLRLMDVRIGKDYRIYSQKSDDPLGQGFWTQWRFVSAFALQYYFRERETDAKAPESENIPLIERIVATAEQEKDSLEQLRRHQGFDEFLKQRYNEFYDGSVGFGFGFLVENHYYGIYRLWSRLAFSSK